MLNEAKVDQTTSSLPVQLRRPECPLPHFTRHRLQQIALVEASPEARLVQVAFEDRLTTRLKFAQRELVGQEAERQF